MRAHLHRERLAAIATCLVVGVFGPACLKLDLPSGSFKCSTDHQCPSPYTCDRTNDVCVKGARGPDGGAGSGGNGGTGGTTVGTGGQGGDTTGGTGGGSDTGGVGGGTVTGGASGGGTTGSGGAGGAGGAMATGGAPGCDTGKHLCVGSCVDNKSIDHCGGSCDVCKPPANATATCDGTNCGFTCTGNLKACKGACIAMTACCDDSECAPMGGKVGQCDSSTHMCSYACGSGTMPCGQTCIPTSGCCAESDCAGECKSCVNNMCVKVVSKDDTDSCKGTCDANGACHSKQGQACTTVAAGCITGTTCADGVCCNTACTETCKACDLATSLGTCTLLASGSTPHGGRACGGTGTCAGTCAGATTGACTFPTTTCGSKTCSGTTDLVGAGTCSAGTCMTPQPVTCSGGFACSAGACKTSCTADADCAATSFCGSDGKCHVDAVQIACGATHTCAVLADGSMRCWGDNGDGELGNNNQGVNSPTPVVVQGLGSAKAIAIGAGRFNTCAVISGGTVRCWGENAYGQDGDASAPANRDASSAVPMVTGATAVAVGDHHACALVAGGGIKCWGNNYNGQIGNQTTSTTEFPTSVLVNGGAALTGAVSVDAGYGDTCAALGTGGVLCWGGRVGASGSALVPETVSSLSGATSVTVSEGGNACAIYGAGGAIKCWGTAPLGDASFPPAASATPVAPYGNLMGFVSLSAGDGGTCGVLGDGTGRCWGAKYLLGSNASDDTNQPGSVSNLTSAKTVCTGATHACAVLANGSVKCWGTNDNGELGVTDSTAGKTPVLVTPW
ncbi:MAG TPA: hypothetical protein VHJ20_18890 [Polyangia bacterium]|nr:hypothetical protein [Polyangia bacterium]